MFKTLAIALVCASTAGLAASQPLTGDQIRLSVTGNTLVGSEEGSPYFEYFIGDGTILGQGKDGEYSGHWFIQGDQLCVVYEDDNGNIPTEDNMGNIPAYRNCSRVIMNGNQVIASSIDEDDPLTLQRGNSRNLPTQEQGGD